MEQRVKFKEITSYQLSDEDLRQMFTTLALLHYHHCRNPNYSENRILARLRNELRVYNLEMAKLRKADNLSFG